MPVSNGYRDAVPYRAVVVDVSAITNRVDVGSLLGKPVRALEVRQTDLATFNLHLGNRGDAIPVKMGSRLRIPGAPITAGIYLSGAAGGAGKTVTLIVQLADDNDGGMPSFEIIDPS